MTVTEHPVPLRRRLWRRLRYPGIRFARTYQTCDDPACDCCLPKTPRTTR